MANAYLLPDDFPLEEPDLETEAPDELCEEPLLVPEPELNDLEEERI